MLMSEQIGQWLSDNRRHLLLLVSVFLVGILCFEAGLLQGKTKSTVPLVLTVPALPSENTENDKASISPSSIPFPSLQPTVARDTGADCVFVGSKNSNKYHLATCLVAKRIKPENRVCFSSKEEAEKRGYLPSCLK